MNVWNEEGKQAYSLYLFFIVFAIPLVQITGSYAFTAHELLAKHDENYMPKELEDKLKEQGVYRSSDETS